MQPSQRSLWKRLITTPPFSSWNPKFLEKIATIGCDEELDHGIVLFREGQVSRNWYILLKGSVAVLISRDNMKQSEQDIPLLITDIVSGQSFGCEEILRKEPRYCTCLARRKSQLIRVESHHFIELYKLYCVDIKSTEVDLRKVVHKAKGQINDQYNMENCKMIKGILIGRSKSQKSSKGSKEDNELAIGVAPGTARCQTMTSLRPPSNHLKCQAMPDLIVDHVTDKNRRSSTGETCTSTVGSSFIRQLSTRLPRRLKARLQTGHHKSEAGDDNVTNNVFPVPGHTAVNVALCSSLTVPTDLQDDYKSHHIDDLMAASLKINRCLPPGILEADNDDLSYENRTKWSGNVLKNTMLSTAPQLIADRKLNASMYKNCMIGTEMVDWLINHSNKLISNRMQVVGIWQALLEAGVIHHVTNEHLFNDKYLFYRWSNDSDNGSSKLTATLSPMSDNPETKCLPISDDIGSTDQDFVAALGFLLHIGPDSLFRMILKKPPKDRLPEEIDVVFDEMLNIKAFSHLSTMVKRELASVMMFEQHQNTGTVLFRQGDKGKFWYVIIKGSVNVMIHNKGIVCTLKEGDDFGKLALVNDAPRAATIVLNEDNSQFLRVDKDDFNRILRDVEANTVRLKEHGKDVLVLEKVVIRTGNGFIPNRQPLPLGYSVMAGTPEKMLEYLLETRIDCDKDDMDTFMDDFLLTYQAFGVTNSALCNMLSGYLHPKAEATGPTNHNKDQLLANKRRVILFLQQWIDIAGYSYFQDPTNVAFIEEAYSTTISEQSVPSCSGVLENIMLQRDRVMRMMARSPIVVMDKNTVRELPDPPAPIAPTDIAVCKICNYQLASTILKSRFIENAAQIKSNACKSLNMDNSDGNVELLELKSSGEFVIFQPHQISLPSTLSLNGCLFICYKDQVNNLKSPIEQEILVDSSSHTLEFMNPNELAQQMLQYHLQLFSNTHEYEYLYQIIGREKFPGRVPTNLDLLIRRFNEVQFWIITEILTCHNLTKRVNLIKKFVKLASQSKINQDLLTFFAVIFGLSNIAVSRLSCTWEKLSTKVRKCFLESESLLDPSKNHRAYRLLTAKMNPPVIPFVPLLMKDLTFAHEGNKTFYDGLVNFEKMHMLAQTLRIIRHCKSASLFLDSSSRPGNDVAQFIRNLTVMDDPKRLMALSYGLEPKKD